MDEDDVLDGREQWFAPAPDALDLILETDAMMSVFAAERFERIAAFRREALREPVPFRGGVPEIIERSIRLELAAAMRITEHAAERLFVLAEALTERYDRMLDALHGARSSVRHAEILIDLLDPIDPTLRAGLVDQAIAWAESLPVGAFRRELTRAVEEACAPSLEERHRDALRVRRAAVEDAPDGMAWLMTLMPAVEARAAFDRATRIAKTIQHLDGETRTLDQIRADVIGDLLIDGRTDTHPETAHGIRAEIVVTVPVLSLLDDDHAATSPAVVEGVGPIPISRARELCGGQKDWMRVLTHPETGMVLSVGRTRYRPPRSLRRLVRWRAGRCLGPGCGMPAHRTEIDHNIAWQDGGRTELDNHGPFCDGHHTVKHRGGWRIRHLDGGAIEWTSPTGRIYTEYPRRPVPAFRTADSETGRVTATELASAPF